MQWLPITHAPEPGPPALRRLHGLTEGPVPETAAEAELLGVLAEQLLSLARVHAGGDEVREELARLGRALRRRAAEGDPV